MKTDIDIFSWRSIKRICYDFSAGFRTVFCDNGGARHGDGKIPFANRSVVYILVGLSKC